MIEFDASELDRFAAHLDRAAAVTGAGLYGVLKVGAEHVRVAMAADASGIKQAPHFPRSITSEIQPAGLRTIKALIGPDKDLEQGALGNIIYFGTSKQGPTRDIGAGLAAAVPAFEKAVVDLATGAL